MKTSEVTQKFGLDIVASEHFFQWMHSSNLSLAITTYEIGKLFLVGSGENASLSVVERTFNRCMGMCATPNGFFMSSLRQIWRFENVLSAGESQDGYDRLYVPQVGYTTGDLDVHDMAVDDQGQLAFVNTLFGCLSTVSETHSFKALWQPPFLKGLVAQDRCHLNGLALRDGRPAFVTMVGQSDVADGWREHRANGGLVMDVQSNAVIAGGLSMPHSPRWYQGRLWLLNSGTGEFGWVDLKTGRFEAVAFCPGYMRGLSFHGDYALVGLSKPRDNKTFLELKLSDRLAQSRVDARCGVEIIDLRSGRPVHSLYFEGLVNELYDVVALPGVRRPMALGFANDDIDRMISIEPS